jgi:hypothetical protein
MDATIYPLCRPSVALEAPSGRRDYEANRGSEQQERPYRRPELSFGRSFLLNQQLESEDHESFLEVRSISVRGISSFCIGQQLVRCGRKLRDLTSGDWL